MEFQHPCQLWNSVAFPNKHSIMRGIISPPPKPKAEGPPPWPVRDCLFNISHLSTSGGCLLNPTLEEAPCHNNTGSSYFQQWKNINLLQTNRSTKRSLILFAVASWLTHRSDHKRRYKRCNPGRRCRGCRVPGSRTRFPGSRSARASGPGNRSSGRKRSILVASCNTQKKHGDSVWDKLIHFMLRSQHSSVERLRHL